MTDYHERAIKAWNTRGRAQQGAGSEATQSTSDFMMRPPPTKGGPHSLSGVFVASDGSSYDPESGLDTEQTFSRDGVYDPKRVAEVHNRILHKYLDNVPQAKDGKPTVYFLGGGPASGKSSLANLGSSSGIEMPDKGTAVLANPDVVRYELPEWGELKSKYPEKSSFMTQEEASKISKDILNTAIRNGQNVVMDTSGDSGYEKLKKKTDKMRAAGARIVANYATLPADEAYRRSVARASSPKNPDGSPNSDFGRYCAKTFFAQTHAAISRDFERSHALFDDVKLWSGPGYPGISGGKPKLIAEGGRGRPFRVHDPILWAAFKAKAHLKVEDLPTIHGTPS